MDQLKSGLKFEVSRQVEQTDLASEVGSGLVDVFSTAMMIGGMEDAAVRCVQPCLPEGFTTVGVRVEVSHKAATPLGMGVSFAATLLQVSPDGRRLTFAIEARDEAGLIGEGRHERAIVEKEKFVAKAKAKLPR